MLRAIKITLGVTNRSVKAGKGVKSKGFVELFLNPIENINLSLLFVKSAINYRILAAGDR